MDWSGILQAAGIPDSPGRQEAADATRDHVAQKRAAATAAALERLVAKQSPKHRRKP